MPIRATFALAITLLLPGILSSQAPAVGAAGWRADLKYLVGTIKAVHPRFHQMNEGQFDSAARSLEARLPRLSDQLAALGLIRLVAMMNDGHTVLDPAGPVFTRRNWFPVRIDRLADGSFVVATSPAERELLGARVTEVGGRAIEQVWDSVLVLAPGDNVFSRMTRVPYWVMMPEMMSALGLCPADRLPLTVDVAGTRRSVSVAATPGDASIWMQYRDRVAGDSTITLPLVPGEADLPFRYRDQPYWFTVNSDRLYAQVNLVSDADQAVRLDRDTARVGLREFGSRVLARIDSGGVDTVVLDLRNNPGGNNGLIQAFVHGLASRAKINRRGHLFVITGRRTYSAAMNFTSLLEDRTAAIFVGEPPGGAPSHYGDATSFTLPNSKLTFNVSTLHWNLGVQPTDVREVHEPDLTAPTTMESLRAGRDPAMEAIRAWKAGGLLQEQLLERYKEGGVDSAMALVRMEAAGQGLWSSRVQEMVAFGYSLYGVRAPGADMRRVFEAITELDPESHYAWFHLGRLHQFSGRQADAAAAYTRALRLRPSNGLIRRFAEVATRQAAQR